MLISPSGCGRAKLVSTIAAVHARGEGEGEALGQELQHGPEPQRNRFPGPYP